MDVCARKDVWDEPETGARDQYIPDAGAGRTLGASLGSGNDGYGIERPRGGRCTGGTGEDEFAEEGTFGVMADVERRLMGLWVSSLGSCGTGLLFSDGDRSFSGGVDVLLT